MGLVMLRVANCASTCANQTSGSAGQKGGILTETAGTGSGARSSGGWTAGALDIVWSLVGHSWGRAKQDSEGRPGHQYNARHYKIEL